MYSFIQNTHKSPEVFQPEIKIVPKHTTNKNLSNIGHPYLSRLSFSNRLKIQFIEKHPRKPNKNLLFMNHRIRPKLSPSNLSSKIKPSASNSLIKRRIAGSSSVEKKHRLYGTCNFVGAFEYEWVRSPHQTLSPTLQLFSSLLVLHPVAVSRPSRPFYDHFCRQPSICLPLSMRLS